MYVLSRSTLALALAVALGAIVLAPPALAGPTSVCGDGNVEPGEECDDGNTANGDACSYPTCAVSICLDGILEPINEECDDGNTVLLDGCTDACLLECGDGSENMDTMSPGFEECDDGNRDPGDGCDELCRDEICGNGVPQSGEGCDTGAACDDGTPCDIAAVDACMGVGSGACIPNFNDPACDEVCQVVNLEPLDKEEQKCVKAVNQGASKLSKILNKTALKCLKDKQKGKVPDFDACLVADAQGKVQKAEDKLLAKSDKSCNPANLPGIAHVDDDPAVVLAARSHPLGVVHAIFGDPGDGNVASKDADKDGAGCQLDVMKRATKLYDTILNEYDKAKVQALKGSKALTAVTSNTELSNLLQNTSATSTKIAKKSQQLNDKPVGKCEGVDPTTAFPGDCVDADLATVLQCVTQRIACETCLQLNEEDGLAIDCDLVDDDVANASCP